MIKKSQIPGGVPGEEHRTMEETLHCLLHAWRSVSKGNPQTSDHCACSKKAHNGNHDGDT